MRVKARQRHYPDGRTVWTADIHVAPTGSQEPERFRVTAPPTVTTRSGAERWAMDQARRMLVKHSLFRGELTTPKSGRPRRVPLTTRLAGLLAELGRGSEWVLPRSTLTKAGSRLANAPLALDYILASAARTAGVPNLRPHALRHTFATLLACEGFRPFWRTTARTRRTHFHTFSSPGFDPPTVTPLARRETTNHAHHPRPPPPRRLLRPHPSHRPQRLLGRRPGDQLHGQRLDGREQRDRLRICPT